MELLLYPPVVVSNMASKQTSLKNFFVPTTESLVSQWTFQPATPGLKSKKRRVGRPRKNSIDPSSFPLQPANSLAAIPSAGTPSVNPSAGIPSINPSADAPSVNPSAGTPSVNTSAGIPSINPSAGTPSVNPSAGTPSVNTSAGIPSINPSADAPFVNPSAGTPSVNPSTGTPSANCSADLSTALNPTDFEKSSTSLKSPTVRAKYSIAQKKRVAQYARHHGGRAAARHFKIHHRSVQRWLKDELDTIKHPHRAKRCNKKGQGRKLSYPHEIDFKLLQWVLEQREEKNMPVSSQVLKIKALTLIKPISI